MKLLLDTHVLLWTSSDTKRLAPRARDVIGDGDNEVLFSVVTLWGLVIKLRVGKLKADLAAFFAQWSRAAYRYCRSRLTT